MFSHVLSLIFISSTNNFGQQYSISQQLQGLMIAEGKH